MKTCPAILFADTMTYLPLVTMTYLCVESRAERDTLAFEVLPSDAKEKPVCYQAFRGRTPGPGGDGTEIYVTLL
jgi:hypothetical protein